MKAGRRGEIYGTQLSSFYIEPMQLLMGLFLFCPASSILG